MPNLTKRQDTNVRSHLAKRASEIGTRLSRFALGLPEPHPGEPGVLREIEMSQAQVTAARAILDKTVPSLQSIDSSVVVEQPGMSEAQAVERLALLLNKHPELSNILKPGNVVDAETDALPNPSIDTTA